MVFLPIIAVFEFFEWKGSGRHLIGSSDMWSGFVLGYILRRIGQEVVPIWYVSYYLL